MAFQSPESFASGMRVTTHPGGAEARGPLSAVLKQALSVVGERSVGLGGTYGFPGGALLPVLVAAGHVAGQTVRVP